MSRRGKSVAAQEVIVRFFALVFVIVGLSSVAPASSSADTRVAETGGDGFRLVKLWGGAEGAVLQIEYYGWLAERCNAGSGSGHMNHLNFYVRLNGKMGVFQETDCRAYEHNGISKPYAIVAVYSTPDQARRGAVVNPRFFDGVDDAHPWDVEIYIQAASGEYDSRYGRNYHFSF